MNCLILAVAVALTAPPPPPSFDAASYYRLIVEQRGKIKSMQGTFETETRPDALAEQSGAMRGQMKRTKISFAWAGEKRLRTEDFDWVGENSRVNKDKSENLYDGKQFRRRENQSFQIQNEKSAYSELNAYLSGLKWPITAGELAEVREKGADSHFLPHFLRATNWSVRPTAEAIDGTSCVVLEQAEKGRRLWLDPARGYCMLRLEYERPTAGHTIWVNQYRNFKEVVPGFFLPMEITGTNVYAPGTKGPQGTLTTTLKVLDLQVNQVPDSIFVLEPKIGDYITDLTTNQIYKYAPPDDRTLEASAEQALLNTGFGERRAVWRRFLYLALAAAAGAGAIYVTARLTAWYRNRSRTNALA